MREFNLGDLDKLYGQNPNNIIGRGTKRSAAQQRESLKMKLETWVREMDEQAKWDEFDKMVKDFADKFEVSYPKAMIYLLFDIF